jgi:hypothetical protein
MTTVIFILLLSAGSGERDELSSTNPCPHHNLISLMSPALCQVNLQSIDDDFEWDDFDVPSLPAAPKAKSPPPLNEGLVVYQGGAPVSKASPGSLVTLGTKPYLPLYLSPDVIGEASKQAVMKGGIIVIIPPSLDVTSVKLVLDGGSSICRGSFCPGTGSGPMSDESVPISAANHSSSFIFHAPARVPINVHNVASRTSNPRY